MILCYNDFMLCYAFNSVQLHILRINLNSTCIDKLFHVHVTWTAYDGVLVYIYPYRKYSIRRFLKKQFHLKYIANVYFSPTLLLL